MRSCLYEGVVTHCRHTPVSHHFRRPIFMALLDLDEAERLVGVGRLISGDRFALRSFLRSDHLYGEGPTLAEEVRAIAHRDASIYPRGPVRLLTQLRQFGFYFSPLNLFFLHDEADERVECVIAEVNNTPWGERRCYVLDASRYAAQAAELTFEHKKSMHVSPFMPMDLTYDWRLTVPTETAMIRLGCNRGATRVFDASLSLRRRELTRESLRRTTLKYPAMGAQTLAAIYFQALRLWFKRCPFFPHPNSQSNSHTPATETPRPKRAAQ